MAEQRWFWVWEERRPAGTPDDRPWLAGLWEEDWPAETFTLGEALPPGALARLGTRHNQARDPQSFAISLYSTPQGWIERVMPYSRVRGEGEGVVQDGQIRVQSEAGVFFHRNDESEPLMVKLEAPRAGGGLMRVYTWWVCVRRLYERGEDGTGWRPV